MTRVSPRLPSQRIAHQEQLTAGTLLLKKGGRNCGENRRAGRGKRKGRKGGGGGWERSLKVVAGQPAGRSWRWAEPEGLGPLGLPPDVSVQLL